MILLAFHTHRKAFDAKPISGECITKSPTLRRILGGIDGRAQWNYIRDVTLL